jgi:hypothetical protein
MLLVFWGARPLFFDNRIETRLNKRLRKRYIIMAKLVRANGGCLGAGWRRKTWLAAISFGEPLSRY